MSIGQKIVLISYGVLVLFIIRYVTPYNIIRASNPNILKFYIADILPVTIISAVLFLVFHKRKQIRR